MANNILGKMPGNWKPIVVGLIPLLLLIIIFALPLKTVPIQVTQTYWDTEMKNEPYTVQEAYTATEPYTALETRTDTVYDTYVSSSNWSYTFDVTRANSTVSVNFQGYSSYPQYYFWSSDNRTVLNPFRYFWDGYNNNRAVIKVSYPEEVTKYRTVTKYRDVVKYREVPTQVQKERRITQYVKMSLWSYLFFEPPK